MFGIFRSIRFVSRWIYRAIVFGLLLCIGAYLLRDPLLQSLTEKRITACTGLDARMKDMDVALLDQRATIENLRIYNTAAFGGGVMLDITELHFELDAEALREGKLHFKLIRLDLAELNKVTGVDGRTNFEAVRDYRIARRAEQATTRPLDELIDPSLEFTGIDMLNLSVGRFTKTFLNRTGPPEVIQIRSRNAVYQRIRSKDDLLAQLIPEIIRSAAEMLHKSYFGDGKQTGSK